MADEPKTRRRRRPVRSEELDRARASREADEAERNLGRAVALGIPLATLVGAVVAGVVASLGSAILVLAAGALIGTIGLLWASVRTLSGDAPLADGFEMHSSDRGDLAALLEEKRRALRALKDLESEHALGKIDDDDYRAFAAQYRQQAKRVLKAIDDAIGPFRDKAEEIAREYLEKQGLGGEVTRQEPFQKKQDAREEADGAAVSAEGGGAASEGGRVSCTSCGASNEADAAFCKQCGISMRRSEKTEEGDVSA